MILVTLLALVCKVPETALDKFLAVSLILSKVNFSLKISGLVKVSPNLVKPFNMFVKSALLLALVTKLLIVVIKLLVLSETVLFNLVWLTSKICFQSSLILWWDSPLTLIALIIKSTKSVKALVSSLL